MSKPNTVDITQAEVTPLMARMPPTERSMPPEMMTRVCPAANNTIDPQSVKMFPAVAVEKNFGSAIVKMIASAIKTESRIEF